jgi:RNA polymerase sigma-70 factor (ECF subfamily)
MSATPLNASPTPFQAVLEALRHGDDAAWREMLSRYSARLIALARSRLFREALRQKVDPEDVVQSVLRTFFRRNREGKFKLASWDALWGLLMAMTVYRAAKWHQVFDTEKRKISREVPLAAVTADGDDDRPSAQHPPVDPAPRPDEVAELLETVRERLQALPESKRRVIELGLLGFDDEVIGAEAGRTRARVGQIRDDLVQEVQDALNDFPPMPIAS